MQIDDDRERLRKFLIEETEIAQTFARRIAAEKLQAARKLAGIESADSPTQAEIQNYILEHHDDVEKRVAEVVNELCKKLLPKERFWDLLKSFGIFSLCLSLPLGVLINEALIDFQNNALKEAATEATSVVFLLALLIASALTVFRKDRQQK